jgi:hypothetical protein
MRAFDFQSLCHLALPGTATASLARRQIAVICGTVNRDRFLERGKQ